MEATLRGRKETVQFLLQNNADINAICHYSECVSYGSTPLSIAITIGNKELVEILLQNNANVNSRSTLGTTVLMRAIWVNTDIEIVKLLLDNAVDIDAKDNFGKTALDLARSIQS